MSDSTRGRATVAELWSLPNVDGPIVGLRRDAPSRARDADATRATESARQAEIDRGYEAGVSAGRAELQKQNDTLAAQVARLDAILGLLARPLPTLEGEVEQQLVLLALAVGKQLARRELKADPGQIAALIREAVGRLPAAARDVRVHLHPEDAAVVKQHLAPTENERAWTIIEDPVMARGGCQITTTTSRIDARLETRLGAILSELLGTERHGNATRTGGGS